MGPGPAEFMSSGSSIKISSLPKLQANGENWVTYKERLRNHLTSKGLVRHVNGTAKKPAEVEIINDKVHKKGKPTPMDDDELETYYDSVADYEQKEAQVRDVIYETIPKSVFLQVKGQPTASKVIDKLVAIFEQKGQATIQETLNKLTNLCYTDGSSMNTHIGTMFEIRERLIVDSSCGQRTNFRMPGGNGFKISSETFSMSYSTRRSRYFSIAGKNMFCR
jgi:hypothetical protein